MEEEALRWWNHLIIDKKRRYSFEFINDIKFWLLTDEDVVIIYQLYK